VVQAEALSLPNPLLRLTKPIFNTPKEISSAKCEEPSKAKDVTDKEMKYYFSYAKSAYCPKQIEKLDCINCQYFNKDVNISQVQVLHDKSHNSFAFTTISLKRKEIVVAFRGTVVGVTNIVTDIKVFQDDKKAVAGVKVHRGFNKAVQSLLGKVINAVKKFLTKEPKFKVILTGHSLGGAMARQTLFELITQKTFPGVRYALYTYGEPRGGNKAYADFFNKLSIPGARVVNNGDVVSHTPVTRTKNPIGKDLIYVHAQPEYDILKDGKIKRCDRAFYEDPNCSNSLDPKYEPKDHSTYFDLIPNCTPDSNEVYLES